MIIFTLGINITIIIIIPQTVTCLVEVQLVNCSTRPDRWQRNCGQRS